MSRPPSSQSRARTGAPSALGRLTIALVVGIVSVGAFAPFGQFWLMPVTLAVLFGLAGDARPGRAAGLGFVFGLGLFGAGSYWILIALSGVGGAPLPLALALLIGLVLLLSAFPAIALALAARLASAGGAARLLLWLPVTWVALEWLRSWIFSGFPWFSIGYSQIASPLVGLAPIGGVFGIGWAVALSAGLLAWVAGTRARRPAVIGLAALVVLWAGAFGARAIAWTHPVGQPMTVALVQGDVAQQAKWSEAAVNQAISRYAGLTAGHWQADLIVWPETAIPAYYRDVAGPLDQLGHDLAAHDSTLITGLLRADPTSPDIYNSVVAVGAGHGFYAKRHLVPFGEYFPVPAVVRRWMAQSGMPYSDFTPGALDQPPIVADGVPLGLSICYEDIFGALLARDVPPAQVLVNVSDDAWFGRSIGPDQHFEIARMRAAEVGRYLLRADNSAVTGIVAPDGRVVKRAPDFKQHVVTGTVQPRAGLTLYARFGDWPVLIALAVAAAAGGLWHGTRRRRHR